MENAHGAVSSESTFASFAAATFHFFVIGFNAPIRKCSFFIYVPRHKWFFEQIKGRISYVLIRSITRMNIFSPLLNPSIWLSDKKWIFYIWFEANWKNVSSKIQSGFDIVIICLDFCILTYAYHANLLILSKIGFEYAKNVLKPNTNNFSFVHMVLAQHYNRTVTTSSFFWNWQF